ncbi:orotidine-5'-phosphate decarboxylase [Marinimicrococcus flavescens]|uniref:Orotidine 5'-phosphate decarboxylase n=1 Tax=Marinimicrococcus flavescens TaxID=3031815 RepID=A0AAP3XT63_9PROT|nr:orotidine-5'-phosphate decarboxylase [Marinimicrococcus flavescens]
MIDPTGRRTVTFANPIFCAVDRPDVTGAASLARSLDGLVGGIKLGLEFVTANGPDGVRKVAAAGLPIFLDLKFHDIPNTVAGAVRSSMDLGTAMLTLHASGGPAMMRAAAEAAGSAEKRPWVLAVTVLTSLDGADLEATGVASDPMAQAVRLARLAAECGLDGAVCSPREIAAIRAACGPGFKLVVPGIRPAGTAAGDQKRVMTAAEALGAGADVLVIGRPITEAADPRAAAAAIGAGIGA